MNERAVAEPTQELKGFPGYVFSGDRDLALGLIPTAQGVLQQVRQFVKNSGAQVYGLTRELSGGIVRVTSNAGIEKVEITATGAKTVSGDDIQGIEILSGAIEDGKIAVVTPPISGTPEFKTLQKYNPTEQAYKYPLKKRPGNYPLTQILPGNTFEDQPRLAVIEQNLIAHRMGYKSYVFIGDEDIAVSKKTIADALITDALATLDAVNNTFKQAVASYPWGYIKYECYFGQTTGFYACIYAEIQSNYMHILNYNLLTTLEKLNFNASVFVESTRIPVTIFYTTIASGSSLLGGQSGRVASSMYSGLMKKAVQVIQGYGMLKTNTKNLFRDAVGVQLKYDWRWARCHGIVVGAGGVCWLVEISVMHGVIAMPLPIFENTKKGTPLYNALRKSNQDILRNTVILFGGLPSGAAFPPVTVDPRVLHQNPSAKNLAQSIASGDVLQLITPAGMSGYFDGISYSNWLGWSFSDSGHEAHNTCADWDGNGRHYKISFTFGAINKNRNPNEAIASASAFFSLVSSTPIFNQGKFTFYDGDRTPTASLQIPIISDLPFTTTLSKTTILATHIHNNLELVWLENIPLVDNLNISTADNGVIPYGQGGNGYPPTSGYILFERYAGGSIIRTTRNINAYPNIWAYRYTPITFGPAPDYNQSTNVSTYQYSYITDNLFGISTGFSLLNGASAWPNGTRDCYAFSNIRRCHSEFGDTPNYQFATDGSEGATVVLPNGSEIKTNEAFSGATDLFGLSYQPTAHIENPFNLYVTVNSFGSASEYFIAFPNINNTALNPPYQPTSIPFVQGFGVLVGDKNVLKNYSFIGYI